MARIFENLWVKIAALILAVLLWFHVATEKVYQHEISLPLAWINLTRELVISEPPPDSIRVIVSATGKTLLRTDWKKRGVSLMVHQSRPGRFKVDVSSENLSLVNADKVELVSVINPREIYLQCDQKIQKSLPVKSRFVITPDEGYAVDNVDSIVPATVNVAGPNRTVAPISFVETEEKIFEGVRNNFTRKIALSVPDIYGLEFEPDSVLAFITVVPVKRKTFTGIAIQLINSPPGWQFGLDPDSIDIIVSGKSGVINSLNQEFISAIADYALIGTDGFAAVQVLLPGNISLISQTADSVKVLPVQ